MDVPTSIDIPRDYVPQTYVEAVLFANVWYHDSGFQAYLEGFRHGTKGNVELPDINLNTRVGLVAWARKKYNV